MDCGKMLNLGTGDMIFVMKWHKKNRKLLDEPGFYAKFGTKTIFNRILSL